MGISDLGKEINVVFKVNSNTINAVLHTTFNFNNPYVTIIIPGIFGDRGDSRAMFTNIARELNKQGSSVLRFDFIGGGSNLGNYFENDFESFIDQLNEITNQVLKAFGFLSKVIYLCFSEGLKFAFHTAAKRDDIFAILSCNGLCVEEASLENVKRPKFKNGILVYDSYLGTWINWNIIEKYKDYYIDSLDFNNEVKYFGLYSTCDVFSNQSRIYWETKKWPMKLLHGADHLYTKDSWLQELSDQLLDWHNKNLSCLDSSQDEFFIRTSKNNICVKLIENKQSSNYVVFLHGLFQNKSGPGFLYSQIANKLSNQHNICMFDFPASGDSDGNILDLTYESMDEVLQTIIGELKERNRNVQLIGIASGCSNYLLFKNKAIFDESIMIFPQKSNIHDYINNHGSISSSIDTCYLYDNYDWSEDECCVLGNIRNRSKGLHLSSYFLKQISEFDPKLVLKSYEGYAFVNRLEYCLGGKNIFVDDKQGLAMSAQIRDKLINSIIRLVGEFTSPKGEFYD